MRPSLALRCWRAHLSFAGILLLAVSVLPIATFAQAGNFSAQVNYSVPGNPNAIAVGAFVSSTPNVPDIAVATQTSNVSILLGNGDGTFQAQYTVPTIPSTGPYSGYVTESVAVGDFNGDGNLDLAVLCISSNFQTSPSTVQGIVIVLLGNGAGQFTAQTPIALDGIYPEQILAAKFDTTNNSNIDLAVLNEDSDSFTILLGNGDGTFNVLPDTSIGIGTQVFEMATADFNKDGKLDLAVGDDTGVAVLLGNGDGTFQSATNWAAPSPNSGAAVPPAITNFVVGDFNGDGNPDIAVQVDDDSEGVYVFLGRGDGTFQSPIGSDVFPSVLFAAGDFNSDGKLDLAAGTGSSNPVTQAPGNLEFFLGNGNGTFSADANTSAGITAYSATISQVIVADLNGDGFPDLVVASNDQSVVPATPAVSVFLNCGLRCTNAVVSPLTPVASVFQQPITLTATVTAANAKASATPTGTVVFLAGTVGYPYAETPLGSATLSDSVATLTYSNLLPGQYLIGASYAGDTNFNASTSTVDPTQPKQTVGMASTTTSVSSSSDPSAPDQSVTFTATVTPEYPGAVVPTGTVTFSSSGNALVAQPLNSSGVATFTTSSLATGTSTITATYTGDENFNPSASSAISQIVGTNAAPFAVSASPSSKTVSAGGSATFTITAATAPSLKSAISFSCSGLPMGASCSFSPAQMTPKGASATTTLTISTTGSGSVFDTFRYSPRWPSPALPFAFLSLVASAILAVTRKRQAQRSAMPVLVLLCVFGILTVAVACGGSSTPQDVTPQGTSQITVMASSNGQSQTATVSLTVN